MKQMLEKTGLLFAVPLLMFTGCRSMDRAYEGMTGMTNPDKVELQAGIEWAHAQPNLRPAASLQRAAYVRMRNTSASPVQTDGLYSAVTSQLQAAGYRITQNPDEAAYILDADIRYFGESRNKELGAGAIASTAVGATAGAVAGHAVKEGRGTGIGAAGGALIGAGLANVMANRNKMVKMDLIVDVRIGERISGGVSTERSTEDSAQSRARTSAEAGSGSQGGTSTGGTKETQRTSVEESFLYHQNTLRAFAEKMRLTPEEALPVLKTKMSTALSSVLP